MAKREVIWLSALVAGIVAAPFLREALRKPAPDARRAAAQGGYVHLSQGTTQYRWRGPDGGPVAVCIHGLTTPSIVWHSIADALAARGYRVLTYDLYGRGMSDRPGGLQDSDFFIRQAEDLLGALDVRPGFTLLGYSMGGAIAAAFAARHPGDVRQLVLIAPAGLGHDLGLLSRVAALTGPFGTWLMLGLYPCAFRRACEAERGNADCPDAIIDAQVAQLQTRGFVPAVLASLRGILRRPMTDDLRIITAAKMPVLAIWGARDALIPLAGKNVLSDIHPTAANAVLEGAGHSLPYTDSARVFAALDAHLTPGSAASP